MLRATIWRDLRWRLVAALLLVAPLAALVAWAFAAHSRSAPASVPDYAQYLDIGWFYLPGPSAVFLLAAVIVSAGSLLRPRDDLAYLFALPVSRRRFLLAHVLASVAALAALVLLSDLLLALGAWGAGVAVPYRHLLVRSVGVLAAASVWVGVTIGVLSVVRYPVLALTLVLGALTVLPANRFRLDLPASPSYSMLGAWDAWAFADPRAWDGVVPVGSLVMALVLGVGGSLLALRRLERFEP
jgi:hypothetical protein